MKNILLLVVLSLLTVSLCGQVPVPVKLYPQGPPQSNGLTVSDQKLTDQFFDYTCDPDYLLFRPDSSKATGRAVIICPGGAYICTAYDFEGMQVARWLNEQGVLAVVLRYRMPNGHHQIPLADLHETIRQVRAQAPEWGVDPQQVGVMGFSAGGHLASTGATHFDAATRPNFAILIYPVISMRYFHSLSLRSLLGTHYPPELPTYYSNDLQVSAQTPPTFIALSDDDRQVDPRNSTNFYGAMCALRLPCELHIYPTGGHGWGWKPTFKYHDELTRSLSRWLRELPPTPAVLPTIVPTISLAQQLYN